MTDSITIVCPTKRRSYIGSVFDNLLRQKHKKWQAIICLHEIEIDPLYISMAREQGNIFFMHFNRNVTLGEMLNSAGLECQTKYICKWDDDDYYSPYFLSETITALQQDRGAVIGKASWYSWVEGNNGLYLRHKDNDFKYSNYLAGGTLACLCVYWNDIQYPNQNLGEDQLFVRRFVEAGLSVWSTSKFNYLQFRYSGDHGHTWNISDKDYTEHGNTSRVSSSLDYNIINMPSEHIPMLIT